MPAVRRLAAILAADVAGYSRLRATKDLSKDGVHQALELLDPAIERDPSYGAALGRRIDARGGANDSRY
jgi:hypothetical protein